MDAREQGLIERSIATLAGLSKSQSSDGVGFSKFDTDFGMSLARRVDEGKSFSNKQSRAAWGLIQKYKGQLLKHGIDVTEIEEPEAVAALPVAGPKLIEIDEKKKIAYVSFRYDESLVSEIRQIPEARFHQASMKWRVPLSPFSIEPLLSWALLNGFEIPLQLKEVEKKFSAEMAKRFEVSNMVSMIYKMKPGFGLSLMEHQGPPVWLGVRAKRIMIADDVGLGKTIESLAIVHELEAFPLLVISTGTGKGTWRYEVSKIFPGKRVCQLNGTKPSAKELQYYINNFDVYVTNYDVLAERKGSEDSGWLQHLLEIKFKSIILDESHRLSGKHAKRTKACKLLAAKVDVRIALSGTPTWNRAIDILSQIEILDRVRDIGGRDRFLKYTCAAKHNGFGWDYTASHLKPDERIRRNEELNKRMRSTFYVRRTKLQVMPFLPPVMRKFVPIDVGSKIYDYVAIERGACELSDDFLKSIDSYSPSIQMAMINEERLRIEMVRSGPGASLMIDAGLSVELARMKLPFVERWIEDFMESNPKEKLIVFAHHRFVIEYLAARFNAHSILGGTKSEDRVMIQKEFQENENCKIIILSLMAASENLTLTAANNVAFAEILYTPGIITQAEGRAHGRVNDPHGIVSHFLMVEGTLDHYIWEKVLSKFADVKASTEGASQDGQK